MVWNRKRQVLISAALLLAAGIGFFVWYYFIRIDTSPVEPQPSTITIGKDTTFVTGPVDQYGYVDYAEALDQRYREGVTVKNNAAIPFWRAFGPSAIPDELRAEFFQRLRIAPLPIRGDYLKIQDHRVSTILNKTPIDRPWKSAEHPRVADWLKENAKPLRRLVEATGRPRFYSPQLTVKRLQGRQPVLNLVLHEHDQAMMVVRILLTRVMWHIGEKRIEDAWEDIRAGSRLARLINQHPMAIGELIAIGIDSEIWKGHVALAHSGQLSRRQLTRCIAELQELSEIGGGARRIDEGSRLILLDCATLLARNGSDGFDLINESRSGQTAFERRAHRYIRGLADWDAVLREINREFDRAVAIVSISDPAQRSDAMVAFTQHLQTLRERGHRRPERTRESVTQWFAGWLVGYLFPGFLQVRIAEDRNRLRLRMAKIVYALAAYHAENGEYPHKLAQLSPGFLKNIPTDPHTSGPLVYERNGDGYRLGSFGENGREDFARGADDKPQGDDFFITNPKK